MSVDRLAVLQEMYDICLRDRKEINNIIQSNNNKINDIDILLQSVHDEMESDFKVFSPRNAESVFKERIEEQNTEKKNIENNNQIQYKKLNLIENQITDIELLLQDCNNSESSAMNSISSNQFSINEPLSLKVLELQETERQRIARELHDTTVQNLAHLVHSIELGSMFIDQDPIRAKLELETCIKSLRADIEEIRTIIFDLRPMSFDDLGFKKSLEQFINDVTAQYPHCEINADICDILHEDISILDVDNNSLILLTIYRIIQEAVVNALKHSQAERVDITVSRDGMNCNIRIKDNGKGFPKDFFSEHKEKHFGISIMKERVGLLKGNILINSEPEVGTEVEIIIKCFK